MIGTRFRSVNAVTVSSNREALWSAPTWRRFRKGDLSPPLSCGGKLIEKSGDRSPHSKELR